MPGGDEERGPGFWSDDRWLNLTEGSEPVSPFSRVKVEDANYLLAIGDEVYVSESDKKNTVQKLTEDKPHFSIDPGQFAYILTAEIVRLPLNVLGFISIRASIKFAGLVNISGFHVDPGYSGRLIFAVFNAGPARIHLKRGQPIFPLWLADLDGPIRRLILKEGYYDIPPTLINQISGDFTTPYQLKEQIDKLKSDVADLKSYKLYAVLLIGLIALVFAPEIKTRVMAWITAGPPQATAPPPAARP
jgi:dCTP deaminase